MAPGARIPIRFSHSGWPEPLAGSLVLDSREIRLHGAAASRDRSATVRFRWWTGSRLCRPWAAWARLSVGGAVLITPGDVFWRGRDTIRIVPGWPADFAYTLTCDAPSDGDLLRDYLRDHGVELEVPGACGSTDF